MFNIYVAIRNLHVKICKHGQLKKVLFMEKNFYKVNKLKEVKEVKNIFYEKNIECSVVYNNEQLVGILTLRVLQIKIA